MLNKIDKKSLACLAIVLAVALAAFAVVYCFIQKSEIKPDAGFEQERSLSQILKEDLTASPGEYQVPDKVLKNISIPGQKRKPYSAEVSPDIINNLTAPK